MSFNTFKSGHRCKECSIKSRIEKRKHTYEYVKKLLKNKDIYCYRKNTKII